MKLRELLEVCDCECYAVPDTVEGIRDEYQYQCAGKLCKVYDGNVYTSYAKPGPWDKMLPEEYYDAEVIEVSVIESVEFDCALYIRIHLDEKESIT